jgi:16S rRNA C967 or C1407 C5-methylase (RsmB/RsmF family)/NOL1/NOP2/fmu family ribosome biogenesis protein
VSKARRSVISPEQIRSILGSIALPGSMDGFIDALTKPTANVTRVRRDIDIGKLPMATEPIDWFELGRRPLADSQKPSRYLAYAAGDYYIQDAGSLLALAAAGADGEGLRGNLICDLCAAPGGKATALVEAIGDDGFVLANEVIGSRIGPLQLNLARTGSDRYAISNLDPETLAERLGGIFDLVVVDAPCSGQAMLGRGKQKTASLAAKQIGHSAIRQNRILDAAVRLVRQGGRLVYSTCTFAEAENEAQIWRLIESNRAVPNPIDSLSRYETDDGCYRLWPHQHDCAGAFAASLCIEQADSHGRGSRFTPGNEIGTDGLGSWYSDWQETLRISQADSIIYGWPKDAPAWVENLAVAGPELGHRVGQTWKPSHAASLRRVPRARALLTTDVDDQQAKQFMRGESIECHSSGWHVVHLGGRPLGWIKANGSIGKNHLPKSARIQGDLIA